MAKGRGWTEEEEAYLREWYAKVPDVHVLAKELGRTYVAVKNRAGCLGLQRDREAILWPPEKLELLRSLYPNHTNEEIARQMGIGEGAVQHKAFMLKLRKDREWMMQRSMKGQFKKGQRSFNKGKKWDDYMSKEGQEASRKTCFKNGSVPFNKKPIGYERKTVNGYREVKVAEPNVFMAKHRVLWEQHYGPIEKGVHIVFVDGNKDNIVIENLRAETIRQKFERCCSIHTTLPPELRQLVQLKGALKRQINKLNKEKKE